MLCTSCEKFLLENTQKKIQKRKKEVKIPEYQEWILPCLDQRPALRSKQIQKNIRKRNKER